MRLDPRTVDGIREHSIRRYDSVRRGTFHRRTGKQA